MKNILRKISILAVASLLMTSCSANNQKLAQTPSASAEPSATAATDPSSTPTPSSSATPSQTPEATPTPEPSPTPVPQEDIKVKAVYLSGSMASVKLDHFIELVNKTELNALVIDIKEGGIVNYDSQVPLVKELGTSKKVYKVDEVLKKCHENNVHVVGRIVVFRDDGLATKKTEFAIKKPNGAIWTEGKHGAWSNPYLEGVINYNIDIAKEAVELGFDEIQFDYVRFPTAKASEVNYGPDVPEKTEAISSFLKKASEEIKKVKDVPVSADIFGIVAESDRDGKTIGQNFDLLGQNIDYISPMIYPSHYANDSNGVMGNKVGQRINGVLFTKPDLDPYGVVYQSLLKVKDRISKAPGFKADVRPYIQDFTASYLPKGYFQTYGVDQIKQQIKAVYDAGYEEWIFWSGKNLYTEDAFLPQE